VKYRTIVADPPWPIGGFPKWGYAGENNPVPYPTMTVEEIKALPVRSLAEADKWHVNGDRGGCILFLWTTTEFLCDAHDVARAWGFTPKAVLVWCKDHRPAGLGRNLQGKRGVRRRRPQGIAPSRNGKFPDSLVHLAARQALAKARSIPGHG